MPIKSAPEPKERQIHIMVTWNMAETLNKLADKYNVTRSELIRQVLADFIGKQR